MTDDTQDQYIDTGLPPIGHRLAAAVPGRTTTTDLANIECRGILCDPNALD